MEQNASDVARELARERDAELEAEVRMLHVPMKQWYNGKDNPRAAELKAAHGDFPAFWQDLRSSSGGALTIPSRL